MFSCDAYLVIDKNALLEVQRSKEVLPGERVKD